MDEKAYDGGDIDREQATPEERAAAVNKAADGRGELSFDDFPIVSLRADGAYVQCWIWVDNDDMVSAQEVVG